MQGLEHTKLLFHSIEGIGRAVELKELLKKSMNAIQSVLRTEASSLMLLDKSTGELNVSIPTGPVSDKIVGFAIPKNEGVGGWVIQNNREYLINDITKDDIFWKDISQDFKTRNLLCVPLRDRNGEAYGVLQAINKIEDIFDEEDVEFFKILAEHISLAIQRNREYDEMEGKLAKKTLLLSETHHRLKNNLFTISALIEMETNRTKEGGSVNALKNAHSRLKSIAQLHSLLYEKEGSDEVSLSIFLDQVIENVDRIYNQDEKNIKINIEIDDIEIPAELSVLCGLALNELLINAFKHAFFERDDGEINIKVLNIENEKIKLIISDNGVGMQQSKKDDDHLFVVNAFVKQMSGYIVLDTTKAGTNFTIDIPL